MNVNGVRCAILFDNEEVGSRTKQGGAGMILPNLVKRVYDALGYSNQEMDSFISKGFMISSDVAHGLHPNYQRKMILRIFLYLIKGYPLRLHVANLTLGMLRQLLSLKAFVKKRMHSIRFM